MKNRFFIIFIFLISFYFSLSWLGKDEILGGGDVGIPLYNPQRILSVVSSSWWDTQATGTTNPVTYTAIPFYVILSLLESLGIQPFITQKLLFFLITFGSGLSMYQLLTHYRFSASYSFIGVLFYIVNITTLSIWHRGVHNGMLFLLLAPLSLLILVKGVSSKRYSSILVFNFVSFIFSYVFGSPAFVFALWLIWLTFLIIEYKNSKSKEREFISRYTAFIFLSWIGTNLWWFLHFIESARHVFGQFSSEEIRQRSSDVLVALREQTDLSYVLRGISKFQLYDVKDWGNFYSHPSIILFTWFPTLIIFFTTLVRKNYKYKIWQFSILILVVVLLVSKGANAPLRGLTQYLYDNLSFLTLLRNPYEKVGIILVIPFSFLFVIGIRNILELLSKTSIRPLFCKSVVFFLIFIPVIFLSWPLWMGQTFAGRAEKSKIKIPSYYGEADNWLQERKGNTRVLHLPLSPGESVDYTWGYSGIEPSQLFFDGSSISYHIGLSSADVRISDLMILVHKEDSENFLKSIYSLNIGWIVLHNEVDWKTRGQENPEKIHSWLSRNDFAKPQIDFGPLSIWQVAPQYVSSDIYTSNSLLYLDSGDLMSNLASWNYISDSDESFVKDTLIEGKFINSFVISHSNRVNYSENTPIYKENALKELPYVKHLPGTRIYPLVQIKEQLTKLLGQVHPVSLCIDLAGKRLVESVLLAEKGLKKETLKNLQLYVTGLEKCKSVRGLSIKGYISFEPRFKEVLGKLLRHELVIETYFKDEEYREEITKTHIFLRKYMALYSIAPQFPPNQIPTNRQLFIFSFSVPKEAMYTIEIENPAPDVIEAKPIIEQIDDKVVSLYPRSLTSNKINFGENKFTEGSHEIHISVGRFKDILLQNPIMEDVIVKDIGTSDEEPLLEFQARDKEARLLYRLQQVKFEEEYEISFESLVIRGNAPRLLIVQDSDPLDEKGKVIPKVDYQIEKNNYDYYWQKQYFRYKPSLNTTSANLFVVVGPWNNCRSFLSRVACELSENIRRFEKESVVQIKNLKARKVFANDLLLHNVTGDDSSKTSGAKIEALRKSSSKYEMEVKSQEIPYILVFPHTNHTAWSLRSLDGQKIDAKHILVNGYANGWIVEKPLPEKFFIFFDLESAKYRGILLTILSVLIICILVYRLDKKKK